MGVPLNFVLQTLVECSHPEDLVLLGFFCFAGVFVGCFVGWCFFFFGGGGQCFCLGVFFVFWGFFNFLHQDDFSMTLLTHKPI